MTRTSPGDLYLDGVGALYAALARYGCDVREDGDDVTLAIPGQDDRPLEVVALSYADPGLVAKHVRAAREGDALRVLVADRIPVGAHELLQDAGWGWLDRRGHLHLRTPGLIVDDYTLPPMTRIMEHRPAKAIRGRAGISLATLLLMSPDDPPGVRDTARQVDMAPSSMSVALERLRDGSLIRQDGRPLFPELFWELADVWTPRRFALGERPDPDDAMDDRLLGFGSDPNEPQGWVMGGTAAAAAWGAPIAATADYPPDFYVPTAVVTRSAMQRFGEVRWERRACSVAVAPTSVLTGASRVRGRAIGPWPIAHPLFVALDLAQDGARGVEILSEWTPPEPFVRVW